MSLFYEAKNENENKNLNVSQIITNIDLEKGVFEFVDKNDMLKLLF
jgi:hypothetical protein